MAFLRPAEKLKIKLSLASWVLFYGTACKTPYTALRFIFRRCGIFSHFSGLTALPLAGFTLPFFI